MRRLWASHAFLLRMELPELYFPFLSKPEMASAVWNEDLAKYDATGAKEALTKSSAYPPSFGRAAISIYCFFADKLKSN